MPPIDVYQNCPCGSGKKIKFCCQPVIDDILKTADLLARNHHEMALQSLVQLEKRAARMGIWTRAWICVQRAMLEILPIVKAVLWDHDELPAEEAQKLRDADDRVFELLEQLPEHGDLLAIHGLSELVLEPGPAVMRHLGRAFRTRKQRRWVTHRLVAETAGSWCLEHGHPLAAGAHWRLAEACDRAGEPLAVLIRFEAESRIAHPLRSPYRLSPYQGEPARALQFAAATELANLGAFSEAAKAFGQVARQERDNAAVWWNIALCHAFAAEDRLAVEAFKAAAANQADFELAAESLMLAALLRKPSGPGAPEQLCRSREVRSPARLLSLLDEHARALRIHEKDASDESPGSTTYLLFDRPKPESVEAWQSIQAVPHALGRVIVVDAAPQQEASAKATLVAVGAQALSQLEALFCEIAEAEAGDPGETESLGHCTPEEQLTMLAWWLPAPSLKPTLQAQLVTALWNEAIETYWMRAPMEMLDGRTPEQARGIPELARPLAAAIGLLEARLRQRGHQIDVDALRERLGLPKRAALSVDAQDAGFAPNSMQMRRLSQAQIQTLNEGQLKQLLMAASRLQDASVLRLVLMELLSRSAFNELEVEARYWLYLLDVLSGLELHEEAVDWAARGRQRLKLRGATLETQLELDTRELLIRLTWQTNDEAVAELASRLWNYYLPKLPEYRTELMQLLRRVPLPGPWRGTASEEVVLAGTAAEAAGTEQGIWTPGMPSESSTGKLWLPGES